MVFILSRVHAVPERAGERHKVRRPCCCYVLDLFVVVLCCFVLLCCVVFDFVRSVRPSSLAQAIFLQ